MCPPKQILCIPSHDSLILRVRKCPDPMIHGIVLGLRAKNPASGPLSFALKALRCLAF